MVGFCPWWLWWESVRWQNPTISNDEEVFLVQFRPKCWSTWSYIYTPTASFSCFSDSVQKMPETCTASPTFIFFQYWSSWSQCSSWIDQIIFFSTIHRRWSSSTSEYPHANPQQRKTIHLCPMQQVIWSSCTSENAHAHLQWSESSHLLRMYEGI